MEKSYIPNTAVHKEYEITDEVFKKYVKRMPNNKSPGPDLIVPFWIKKLTSLHSHIQSLLRESYDGVLELPDWLITSRTILTAKTHRYTPGKELQADRMLKHNIQTLYKYSK